MMIYVAPTADGMAFKVGVSDNPAERLSAIPVRFSNSGVMLYRFSSRSEAFAIERFIHQRLEGEQITYPGNGGTEYFFIDSLDTAKQLLEGVALEFHEMLDPIEYSGPEEDAAAGYSLLMMGLYFRSKRLGLNISQEEAAKVAGIARKTLTTIEAGESANIKTLLNYAHTLGIPFLHPDVTDITKHDSSERLRSSKATANHS